jgi:hypothetical protein
MRIVRRLVIVGALTCALLTASSTATPAGEHQAAVTVRLVPGIHLVQKRVTDVSIPVPRLVFASFDVQLARHPCECGMPNFRSFPRDGAFVLMWEYERMSIAAMKRWPFQVRPRHFTISPGRSLVGSDCGGPNWSTGFRVGRRPFQLEVYLGPRAGADRITDVEKVLDNMHIDPLG